MIANDSPFCPISSFEKHLSVFNPMQGSRLTFQLASSVASDRIDSLAKTDFSLTRYSNLYNRIKSSKC